MKGKILESIYNPGYDSWVMKQTKFGTFDSQVYLDEDDEDIDNSFDGCRIAAFDCDLKAYKERAKWFRQRAIGARTLANNLETMYNWGLEDPMNIKLWEQVDYMFREADKAKATYESMKAYRPMFIESLLKKRREARELINKKEDGK